MLTATVTLPKIKYESKESHEFYRVLHQRIEYYFKNNSLSKFGDWRIRLKIILYLVLSLLLSFTMHYFIGRIALCILKRFSDIFTGFIINQAIHHPSPFMHFNRGKRSLNIPFILLSFFLCQYTRLCWCFLCHIIYS